MTSDEFNQFTEFYADQCGVNPLTAANQTAEWLDQYRRIPLATAKDCLKRLLLGERVPHGAGRVLVAVVKEWERANPAQTKNVEDVPACAECNFSGMVTVPHHKDYDQDRYWKGTYDMVVACRCERAVVMFRFKMMTIDQYEQMFPRWKDEYPIRRYERMARLGDPWAQRQVAQTQQGGAA